MRKDTSLDALNGENRKSGRTGLVILVIAVAHAVFYFAASLHLPFDLDDLFLLGYVLVLVDSGLVAFLGITLLKQALSSKNN